MNRIDNILVIADPTAAAHPAVDKAALLAAKLGARLELVVCDTKAAREARLAAHVRSAPDKPLFVNMKEWLEALARPLRARGLDVATETACGDPLHAALLERVKHTHADLVVKDTHHHSLAQRTFITNTDWALIRRCPAPLLLVKPQPWTQPPRIVAAVDPTHANDKPAMLDHRVLGHASLLAGALAGELHVVHAYVPLAVVAAVAGGAAPSALSVSPEQIKEEETRRRAELLDLTKPYNIDPARLHLELGGPGELLPRIARTTAASILVMGAISRTGLKRLFLGATAEDVLERLPCDELIVKPPDFADLLPF